MEDHRLDYGSEVNGYFRPAPTGWEYNGRTYPVRGDFPQARYLDVSKDGALVIVIGENKHDPSQRKLRKMIDVFDRQTGRRLASLDLDYFVDPQFPLFIHT